MPSFSSAAKVVRHDCILLAPLGVCHCRCSQIVWANSLRLSSVKVATVFWMLAICFLVNRLPAKVVDVRFSMRWSMVVSIGILLRYLEAIGAESQGFFVLAEGLQQLQYNHWLVEAGQGRDNLLYK
jgi:hypothetical protein